MFSKALILPFAALLLCHCSGNSTRMNVGMQNRAYGCMPLHMAPKVVNVSSWDPKEQQRGGCSFSEHDVSALARNGATGLIARAGKGGVPDAKCAAFLQAAKRSSLRLGTYYFMTKEADPVAQADQYVALVRAHAQHYGLRGEPILLVGDFDTRSTAGEMLRFLHRVESRTGVRPVVYLENSSTMRRSMMNASPEEKSRLRRYPYWLALYSHETGFNTPADLLRAHGIWSDWAMWQYGGVEWRGGRSQPLVYHNGPWRAPRYFGTMSRPLEHNAFNGNTQDLGRFWAAHSWIVP